MDRKCAPSSLRFIYHIAPSPAHARHRLPCQPAPGLDADPVGLRADAACLAMGTGRDPQPSLQSYVDAPFWRSDRGRAFLRALAPPQFRRAGQPDLLFLSAARLLAVGRAERDRAERNAGDKLRWPAVADRIGAGHVCVAGRERKAAIDRRGSLYGCALSSVRPVCARRTGGVCRICLAAVDRAGHWLAAVAAWRSSPAPMPR